MIERRFRPTFYAAAAVDAAAAVYAPYGTIEVDHAGPAVRVTANAGIDEVALADELANYVLGATVEARGADAERPA